LGVGEVLIITDYFLIMSGNTERQSKTISAAVQEELEKSGIRPIGKEGESEGKWVLLDYGDVVVHIFRTQEREYYQLERLWKDVPTIKWDEEGEPHERLPSYYSDQLNA
jgi:ribosome-associated protein